MKNCNRIKLAGTVLCELFAALTVILLLVTNQYDRLPLAFATLLLVLIPGIAEKRFSCKLCLPLYLFALLYSVGPMLGQSWNLYYTVSWWDKLLHICGGVMFAVAGSFFFTRCSSEKTNFALNAVFSLCFSMAVSVLWEFGEFGADCFFGMDMQDDTVITSLTSYLLGERVGVTGSLRDIQTVAVNGIPLPTTGYIDIGLIDTMLDMLLESLGALVTTLLLLWDKGRHSLIADQPQAAGQRQPPDSHI